MIHPIDREALRLIDGLENELATFHGLRRLWSETVANHVPFVAGETQLMERQRSALRTSVAIALSLHSYLWPGDDAPHSEYRLLALDKDPVVERIKSHFVLAEDLYLEGDAAAQAMSQKVAAAVVGLIRANSHDDIERHTKELFDIIGLTKRNAGATDPLAILQRWDALFPGEYTGTRQFHEVLDDTRTAIAAAKGGDE